jgi:hypothetical protein
LSAALSATLDLTLPAMLAGAAVELPSRDLVVVLRRIEHDLDLEDQRLEIRLDGERPPAVAFDAAGA